MELLHYELKLSLSKSAARRGEKIAALATFSELTAPLQRVMLRITSHGIFEMLKRESEHEYSWSMIVPWEAPLQTYKLEIFGIGDGGMKGPITEIPFTVTP